MKILFYGVLGLAIIALDLLFIPGGLLLIVGGGMLIYSIYLNYMAFGFISALVEIMIILAILPILIKKGLSRLALKNEMRAEDGFVGVEDYSIHLGKVGKAVTDLRPAGTVVVVDGNEQLRLDCIADGGYIEAGTEVQVSDVRGPSLVVRRRISN